MEWLRGVVRQITRRHVFGWLFVAFGFLITAFVAYLGSQEKPPPVLVNVVLVVLAGMFQVFAGSQFQGIGRADPGLARASVRRLVGMTQRVAARKHVVEEAYDTGNVAELRRVMGLLSVDLSWLEEGLLHSKDDWVEFHEDALRAVVKPEENVPKDLKVPKGQKALTEPQGMTEGEEDG